MSDIRFIMIGMALIFVGFIVLSILSPEYRTANIESSEFGECYEYFDDRPPLQVDCAPKIQDSTMFFVGVLGIIGAGIAALVKGYRGKWDSKVKPEEMLGPGGEQKDDPDDKEES